MSVFMSICTVFLFVSIANLIEAIRHHWSTENKYFAYIGPLIPVGLMLIKFWQNPFAPVNFFIIAIWVVILIVIILLWKKVHLIVDKFFAQEVAKDNVLAKLDPKDVEGSLQYLNEKEREFFLIYEFSDTAILWFGLEEYLTQTSGIHLQEVIDYLPVFNAQEIADQLKWYTKWHNSTPPFSDDEILSMAELDDKITDINLADPFESHLEAFATKYASFLGVSEADLHPDKQHIEQFYQARKNREKTNPERYFEDLHSGVRYETEKERQKRVRKEHRKMERQMKKQKR